MMLSGAGGRYPRMLCGLHCVVVFLSLLHNDLGLLQAVEDLSIEQLVRQPSIEALAITVFPRRSRFVLRGLPGEAKSRLYRSSRRQR